MGTRYTSQATSGYNSSPPPDDGTQVAANLITWAAVRTKLADVLKTFAEAINTALVSALDLSARAISSNDTAIASDHWKTLQVTGATTIQLSSAASMGAGYEVGIFNAGVGVVTVTPAGSDTINGVSASVTIAIKGSMIFRTNQALTGYNVVGQNGQVVTLTASTSVVTPLLNTAGITGSSASVPFIGPTGNTVALFNETIGGARGLIFITAASPNAATITTSSGPLGLTSNAGTIKWGDPLVALGAGAAPTFGTIGGSGPATAAQNSWMRVVDSGNNVFWVPVWK